jgi:hypothetical protein
LCTGLPQALPMMSHSAMSTPLMPEIVIPVRP